MIGASHFIKIELLVLGTLEIKELDQSSSETTIYGPVTPEQLMSDFNISSAAVEIIIHFDDEGDQFQIYSATKPGIPVATTSKLENLGFTDPVNSVQVTVQNKGNAQCKIEKSKLHEYIGYITDIEFFWFLFLSALIRLLDR